MFNKHLALGSGMSIQKVQNGSWSFVCCAVVKVQTMAPVPAYFGGRTIIFPKLTLIILIRESRRFFGVDIVYYHNWRFFGRGRAAMFHFGAA